MKHALILATALALPTLAAAQTITIYEPVPDPVMKPIERTEAGVVKAQYIKPGDLSPEEYQRLLDEADRVRAFQASQGQAASSYITIDRTAGTAVATPQAEFPDVAPTATPAGTTVTSAAPTITANTRHTVVKGDTLYNIAKRNNVSVDEIRNLNALTDTGIKLGQTLLIPTNVRTVVEPTSALNTQSQILQASTVAERPYAVAPGDTLYSISRRACVSVAALQGANALGGTDIQPGQKLALPVGHCLK